MEIQSLKEKFIKEFGGEDKGIRVFTSPGRVNLIGEHTDYNGGYVFPAALTMASTVIARPRQDNKIRLMATDLGYMVEADLDKLEEYKSLKWGNYQLGVADELIKAGYNVEGCDMLFDDKVPLGSGLSSSAAIEVVTAITLVSLGSKDENLELDMIEMAKISQIAEHNYIGVKCGIMDQFASAMGKENHAIFLDCKTLDFIHVPLEMDGYKIVISNTNKKRSLGEVKYNERRSQCEEGLEILKNVLPEATCLGDVSMEEFKKFENEIKDEIIKNRVMHVISEDDRVLKSIDALKAGNLKEFGRLMIQSHDSLRDLYEVTGIELDSLVEEALKVEGVIGSRMTGAGFGGCTVSIVKEESVDNFIKIVGDRYFSKIGHAASFYISEIGNGGREIK